MLLCRYGGIMATNDIILLDSIIDEIHDKNKVLSIGSLFEKFAYQQILKSKDLSTDEIDFGIVDDRDDGGIDAIYLFVNGQLITDIEKIKFFKSDISIEVIIFTSKHHDTFKQATLTSQTATIKEFFNLNLSNGELIGCYNRKILSKRDVFIEVYRKLASKIIKLNFKFIYVSRGNTEIIEDNIIAQSNIIKDIIKNYFSSCEVKYDFVGAKELLEFYRTKNEYKLSLRYKESISTDNQKFIILCTIKDFYEFLKDEKGELKRYLFESNVRDYMGYNKVNSDILNTLNNNNDVDFWWLNNGITILSNSAINIGKELEIDNVQIVNGLQTSQTIFNYFKSKPDNYNDDRMVMVKIITETDESIRNKIIQATNNQSLVQEYSLHSIDKIQTDIEEMLLKKGIYYERRLKFYSNQGISEELITTPLYLACGFLAIIEKDVFSANKLKQRFMRDDKVYDKIFKQSSILIWSVLFDVLKKSESVIKNSPKLENRKLTVNKILRHLLSFLVVANHFKTFTYNSKDVVGIENEIEDLEFEKVYETILRYENFSTEFNDKYKYRKKEFVHNIISHCAKELDIKNINCLFKAKTIINVEKQINSNISIEIIDNVKKLLPKQPWQKGMHLKISKQLNITPMQVSRAIQKLIDNNICYNQVDGIVYDYNGKPLNKIPYVM